MAAALIGGAFLNSVVNVLVEKLASPEVLGFFKARKIDDGLLKKLGRRMNSVNGVLDDAEESQITKPAVKRWLDDLKDALYEAEDLLEEIDYEARRSKLESASQSSTGKARNFFSSLNTFNKGKEELVEKLENILGTLDDLVKLKDILGLKEGIREIPLSKETDPDDIKVSDIYGREEDKEAIIKLLSDDANGYHPGVIPIVGMGGIGKTTVAQLVFKDSRVQQWFDVKAWVWVSENFDVSRVKKDILKQIEAQTSDTTDGQGKKILLVLDNVWNVDYADCWENILPSLESGAQGSKILVTTRNKRDAEVMQTVDQPYRLKEIADEDCWSLFAKYAFKGGNYSTHPGLEEIGRQIAGKCRGLPLAAKTIGNLLRLERDSHKWKNISESNMWGLKDENIPPALRLSYYYLPSHLKRCFAYCAIFPKGYSFEKKKLTLLWMAEGFLVESKGDENIEEIGNKYFDDLVSRSFFQQSSEYELFFIMHDLINDLAVNVSGEFCFRFEVDNSRSAPKKTRYLSNSGLHDVSKLVEAIHEAQTLRTFLPLGDSLFYEDNMFGDFWLPLEGEHLSDKVFHDLLLILKRVRVLSLPSCHNITQLPNSIGNMKLLRCLNLSRTPIERLPEVVSTLYNLQTIILSNCKRLVELPTDMASLIGLHHLDITRTGLQEMPSQMGKLTKLQKLTDFFIGKRSGSSIKELGAIKHLQGNLRIWNIQNVVDAQETLEANVKGKEHLKELEFTWNGDANDSQLEREVLEKLEPHVNMEYLSIIGYRGTKFPNWVGDSSFSSLTRMKLSGCKYCPLLPPLGQLLSLKFLRIEAFDGVVVVGTEFYGTCTSMKPFESLKTLYLGRMPQWREWISNEPGAFPRLEALDIYSCPNLINVPLSHLPSSTRVSISECENFVVSIPTAPSVNEMCLGDYFHETKLKKLSSGMYCLEANYGDFLIKGMEQIRGLSTCLEELTIMGAFDSLKCLQLELFPNLNSVCICGLENLESLCAHEGPLGDFTSLTYLDISGCHNLVTFPQGGLPAPNLRELCLVTCSNLKSLPKCMHSLLPSLVVLKIIDCPELESFPEGGLPSKLESLSIICCNKLIAGRMQWDLQLLPSLSKFRFGGKKDVESFPEETLLPSTLTSLEIFDLANLNSLDCKGLQHLTHLDISYCPKLESLTKEGLPSTLTSLNIINCPLLMQRLQRREGEDWDNISHIPNIQIQDHY